MVIAMRATTQGAATPLLITTTISKGASHTRTRFISSLNTRPSEKQIYTSYPRLRSVSVATTTANGNPNPSPPHREHVGSANPTHETKDSSPPPPQLQFGLRRITGDGRCLFRALVQGNHYTALLDANTTEKITFLSPTEETAAADACRQAICDSLLARKDHFSAFIDHSSAEDGGTDSFEEYVERMRQCRTFGGELELAAAADVMNRSISVFALNPQKQELALVSEYAACPHSNSNLVGEGAWPIPLVYTALGRDSGHYDLLAPTVF